MAKSGGVWLTRSDVYKMIARFTDNQERRDYLRRSMCDCAWARGWNWAFAEWAINYDRDFAAFLGAIA